MRPDFRVHFHSPTCGFPSLKTLVAVPHCVLTWKTAEPPGGILTVQSPKLFRFDTSIPFLLKEGSDKKKRTAPPSLNLCVPRISECSSDQVFAAFHQECWLKIRRSFWFPSIFSVLVLDLGNRTLCF